MRVLIVEDDPKTAAALRESLEAEGNEAEVASDGVNGLAMACSGGFDLVVLDLMLPGLGGLEVLTELRSRLHRFPVLILTARDSVNDRVRGLDLGADDYLVKPFDIAEFLARVRALSRRGQSECALRLETADLAIDVLERRAWRAGQEICLTVREFELLEYLFRNKGRVVSKAAIALDVWKTTRRASVLDNVIEVHIGRLRRKIDDAFELKLIETVRGVGYFLNDAVSGRAR